MPPALSATNIVRMKSGWEQRCWFHKSGNIPDKFPKSVQSNAREMVREMWQAPTKEDALPAYRHFVNAWHEKYRKAVECLQKDKDLFTFYDFPAAHWAHIRTANPIESTYATIRLRTKRTKGCGSRMATLTMVWKLAMEAQKTWRRLMGYQQITRVMEGRRFVDGELEEVARGFQEGCAFLLIRDLKGVHQIGLNAFQGVLEGILQLPLGGLGGKLRIVLQIL